MLGNWLAVDNNVAEACCNICACTKLEDSSATSVSRNVDNDDVMFCDWTSIDDIADVNLFCTAPILVTLSDNSSIALSKNPNISLAVIFSNV